MTRSSPAITLLFWTMFVVGGLSLAVSMVLPVWLDYRAEVQRTDAAEKRRDDARKRLVALERKIDHLQNDPAYLERIAQREFGLGTPQSPDAIEIQLADQSSESPAEDQADASNAGGESHVVAVVDEALRTHPLVRLYVLDQTRPIVMGMSAGLLAAAIVLLGRNASARAPAPPPEKA